MKPRPRLLARWSTDALPTPGTRLVLEEIDDQGLPTGRTMGVVVTAEVHGSSTMRRLAIAALTEPPRMCLCNHIRILHRMHRGPCTLCGDELCPLYRPKDEREEID